MKITVEGTLAEIQRVIPKLEGERVEVFMLKELQLKEQKQNPQHKQNPQASYWAKYTPEERQKIMKKRMKVRMKNKKLKKYPIGGVA